jgi:hypothetical protein
MSSNLRIKRRVGKRSAVAELFDGDYAIASWGVEPSRDSSTPEFLVVDHFLNALVGYHDDFAGALKEATEQASAQLATERSPTE